MLTKVGSSKISATHVVKRNFSKQVSAIEKFLAHMFIFLIVQKLCQWTMGDLISDRAN